MGKVKYALLCFLAAVMIAIAPAEISLPGTVTEASAAAKGWVKEDGAIYYYNEAGTMLTGKKKIDGKIYYFSKKASTRGQLQTGVVKIKKKEYYFTPKGALGTIGQAAEGIVKIKGRGFCCCKKGKIIKNKWVDDYKFGSNGAMTKTSATIYKYVKKTAESVTNAAMAKEHKLKACYNYMCSGTFTYVTKRPFSRSSNWRQEYGLEMFKTHSGVCYNFAAAFAYLARYVGYEDVRAVAGELLYLDGHWDLHSWTTIIIDGTKYVFDASMEHGGMGDFWYKTYSETGRQYREWTL